MAFPRLRAANLALALALLGLAARPAAADVAIKVHKDTNIGWGHGTGKEAPGTPVATYPAVVFHGFMDSGTDCANACVVDQKCTGYVYTDSHDEKGTPTIYHKTCYFRTDGCHEVSCDKNIRKEGHHESGYLYCEGDETQTAMAQLDVCGHEEAAGAGMPFVLVLVLAGGAYVGGGVALGRRAGGKAAGLKAHPHWPRWVELGGLVSDGVAFSRAGGKRGSRSSAAGYAPVPSAEAPRGSSGKDKKKEKRTSSGSGGGKEKEKEKKSSKQKRGSSSSQSAPAAPVDAPPAPATAAAAPASGTAAGGGGRWVHLPG